MCVVMTPRTAKGILNYLETGATGDQAEDAREIYVAASRAERLLVFAVPKSQAKRLSTHVAAKGSVIQLTSL